MFVEMLILPFRGNISAKAILTIIISNFHIKIPLKKPGDVRGRNKNRNTDNTDYTDNRRYFNSLIRSRVSA